jgi:nitroreductase
MELKEAIKSRRSVRAYKPQMVEREIIEELLEAAVLAPTATNAQPWTFVVIQGAEKLHQISIRAKMQLLESQGDAEWFARYKDRVSQSEFNMFYGAPAIIVIYCKPRGFVGEYDCCLAAENLMLTARDKGLGTCWIGFSGGYFDTPEAKKELGVPLDYKAVAPIIVGYPAGETQGPEKNPPEVICWK